MVGVVELKDIDMNEEMEKVIREI